MPLLYKADVYHFCVWVIYEQDIDVNKTCGAINFQISDVRWTENEKNKKRREARLRNKGLTIKPDSSRGDEKWNS
jgi:hypothetical protein